MMGMKLSFKGKTESSPINVTEKNSFKRGFTIGNNIDLHLKKKLKTSLEKLDEEQIIAEGLDGNTSKNTNLTPKSSLKKLT
jgi:hypothetical protein